MMSASIEIAAPSAPSAQRRLFARSEGGADYERTHRAVWGAGAASGIDPPLRVLRQLNLSPRSVLEVGCSDGWRIGALAQHPGIALAAGVDASTLALRAGRNRYAGTRFARTTTEALPFRDQCFDLVVLGFFLHGAERGDLFRIAMESDRVLREGGYLLLYDFFAERPSQDGGRHLDGCCTYKMDYRRMFLWNPAYRCVYHEVSGGAPALGGADSRHVVSVLRREEEGAYADIVAI